MTTPTTKFIGETEQVVYNRTRKSTSNLLALLMASHGNSDPMCEFPINTAKLQPIPNEALAEAQRISVPCRAYSQVENIQRVVASTFPGISLKDIRSARRTANVIMPRQISMYLAKTLTNRTLPEIGRRTGGRDHTTVLYAVRKIEKLIQTDAALAKRVENIRALISEPS
jgi:chromosomal replication initiation ATPase DnaA